LHGEDDLSLDALLAKRPVDLALVEIQA